MIMMSNVARSRLPDLTPYTISQVSRRNSRRDEVDEGIWLAAFMHDDLGCFNWIFAERKRPARAALACALVRPMFMPTCARHSCYCSCAPLRQTPKAGAIAIRPCA